MKTNAEKREGDRRNYTVPIVFSYFNKNDNFDAQTLNHSEVKCGVRGKGRRILSGGFYKKFHRYSEFDHVKSLFRGET